MTTKLKDKIDLCFVLNQIPKRILLECNHDYYHVKKMNLIWNEVGFQNSQHQYACDCHSCIIYLQFMQILRSLFCCMNGKEKQGISGIYYSSAIPFHLVDSFCQGAAQNNESGDRMPPIPLPVHIIHTSILHTDNSAASLKCKSATFIATKLQCVLKKTWTWNVATTQHRKRSVDVKNPSATTTSLFSSYLTLTGF